MTRPLASPSVHLRALFIACYTSLVVGLAGQLSWRWVAVHGLDVPASLSSLQTPSLVISALLPVIGNGFGYFMVYRQHVSRALLLFLGPGVLLTGVGMGVSLAQLPLASEIPAVLVTVVVSLITPVVTMAILLTRKNLQRSAVPLVALVQ